MLTHSRFLSLVLTAGAVLSTYACGEAPAPAPAATSAAVPETAGHAHEAPHGGVLVELGEEFGHVELVLDGAAGTITAYVLDGEGEQAVRLTQGSITLRLKEPASLSGRSFDLAARANVLTGETAGDTSQFVLANDAFKGLAAFQGALVHVAYKGQDFRDVPVTYAKPSGDPGP